MAKTKLNLNKVLITNFPDIFRNIPRNGNDYYGGLVLFSVNTNCFYRIEFGCGDNLTHEDTAKGYDDYLNYDVYEWNGERSLMDTIRDIKYNEGMIDEIEGLEEKDGGMMLVKHKNYANGDIRLFLENVLEMAGYGVTDLKNLYKDLMFIYADYVM